MSKVACICEGRSEQAIMDILQDHDCLIFTREDLLEEEVLKCRSAKNFQKEYLDKTMDEPILVYRILDSRNEKFKLSGPYWQKVSNVINVVTSPEIEMLIIHAEDCYDDYSRKKWLKPSVYVQQYLRMGNMKNYDKVSTYFRDIRKLKKAIRNYHSKSHNKMDTIYNLLLKCR